MTQSPQTKSTFVTVGEVARQLRVSNMTVYRLISAGDLARRARRASRTGCGKRTSTRTSPPATPRPADHPRTVGAPMARRYETVSFLSDYGHADEFVGVVHSVIRSIAPHVVVVDLVHDLRPVRRPGRVAGAVAGRPVRRARASCSPSSTPASAPTGGPSPSRSARTARAS